jgi:hypothetical protein
MKVGRSCPLLSNMYINFFVPNLNSENLLFSQAANFDTPNFWNEKTGSSCTHAMPILAHRNAYSILNLLKGVTLCLGFDWIKLQG